MRKIIVEPARLNETAARIEEADAAYERLYRSLYSEVDKMSASWKGKDNTMFADQIRGYERDLDQISVIMRQYADFLRNSASAYADTQEELRVEASRLRV